MTHMDTQAPDMTHTYTRREVAGIFRVTPRTIERWQRKGLLTNVSPGRDARYRMGEVLGLLQRGKGTVTDE